MDRERQLSVVSFLFTDVVGSSTLWERAAGLMAESLARHDTLVRAAVSAHGGKVFSTAGDGFAAAFSTPLAALAAAADAQRSLTREAWAAGVELQVRMGVHTGAAMERGGDYFGAPLNRAARVMGLAHGGQVLCSQAVFDLTKGMLDSGVSLVALGDYPLRGLAEPERIFQLLAPGLAAEFPPLGLAGTGNLPVPATTFVGRETEIKEVAGALGRARLVTVVGPGGVGKTRLAIEAAFSAGAGSPDGVWLVELAPVNTPEEVSRAAATALSVRPQEGMTLDEAIVDALRDRQLVVVVDNCEHVLDAAAALAGALVDGCPGVRVLATSREPLAIAGEHVFSLDPLDPASDGAQLFLERARAAGALLDPLRDGAAIETLCARLDGVPLAIELAAGRARALTPADLLERLTAGFALLQRPGRGGQERHRSLQATVEWSYRLLTPFEQQVFDRLSVFSGSFDLAAAEAVCVDLDDEGDVIDVVTGLVDKSLVTATPVQGRSRLRLLDTLRHYSAERLHERGLTDQARARHLAHYTQQAAQAQEAFEGTDAAAGAAWFDANWDNLRAAVGWAIETGDTAAAATIVSAPVWYAHFGFHLELDSWAQDALTMHDAPPLIYGVTAWLAHHLDDSPRGRDRGTAGLALHPPHGSRAELLCLLGVVGDLWISDDVPAATRAVTDLSNAAAGADSFLRSFIFGFGALVFRTGDPAGCGNAAAQAAAIAAPLHNPYLDAWVLFAQAQAKLAAGAPDAAHDCFREAVAVAETSGNLFMVANGLAGMMEQSDHPEDAARAAVETAYHQRDWGNVRPILEHVARLWTRTGDLHGAAVIFGHHQAIGYHFGATAKARDRAITRILDHPDGRRWLAEGAAIDRHDLVAYVLDRLHQATRGKQQQGR